MIRIQRVNSSASTAICFKLFKPCSRHTWSYERVVAAQIQSSKKKVDTPWKHTKNVFLVLPSLLYLKCMNIFWWPWQPSMTSFNLRTSARSPPEVESFCQSWCQMDADSDGTVDLDEFSVFFSKRKVDRWGSERVGEEIAKGAKFGCVLRVAKFFFNIGREWLVEKCFVFHRFFWKKRRAVGWQGKGTRFFDLLPEN